MNIKSLMDAKNALNDYLKNKADYSQEYVVVATEALRRSGFEQIVIFNHKYVNQNEKECEQLVMINMNASISKIISGIIFDNNGEIDRFKISHDCKCVTTNATARCLIMENVEGESDLIRLRALSKDKISWMIHYNTDEINEKAGAERKYAMYLCNAHTHGLSAFNHRDFQLVLDIEKSSTAFLLNRLAERVRDGESFSDGELVADVYPNCKVKLALAKEANREVFRVLIPDENDKYPGDEGCKYPYSEQDRIIN